MWRCFPHSDKEPGRVFFRWGLAGRDDQASFWSPPFPGGAVFLQVSDTFSFSSVPTMLVVLFLRIMAVFELTNESSLTTNLIFLPTRDGVPEYYHISCSWVVTVSLFSLFFLPLDSKIRLFFLLKASNGRFFFLYGPDVPLFAMTLVLFCLENSDPSKN